MALGDQSKWRFVVTDMSGNANAFGTGMIQNASSKTFANSLNAGRTASCVMNIDNPAANFLLTQDALLKVYRKSRLGGAYQLLMVGDVVHVEETATNDSPTVQILAADPWFRFQHRLIGLAVDARHRGIGFTDGTVSSLKDLGQIVIDALNQANSGFNTGVTAGTISGASFNTYVGPVYAIFLADLITQSCNTLGGPDIEIVPNEPSGAMPATMIGTLNIHGGATGGLGQARPNTVFEYGTGSHNLSGYNRLLSKDGMANSVISLPQGWPTLIAAGDAIVAAIDVPSLNAVSLFEDVVTSDLTVGVLRQELCNEALAVRKRARQQIQISPTINCNVDYNVDYGVGDIVVCRALVNNTYRFNGTVRIYGVQFQLDDNDAETLTLTTIPA